MSAIQKKDPEKSPLPECSSKKQNIESRNDNGFSNPSRCSEILVKILDETLERSYKFSKLSRIAEQTPIEETGVRLFHTSSKLLADPDSVHIVDRRKRKDKVPKSYKYDMIKEAAVTSDWVMKQAGFVPSEKKCKLSNDSQ